MEKYKNVGRQCAYSHKYRSLRLSLAGWISFSSGKINVFLDAVTSHFVINKRYLYGEHLTPQAAQNFSCAAILRSTNLTQLNFRNQNANSNFQKFLNLQ